MKRDIKINYGTLDEIYNYSIEVVTWKKNDMDNLIFKKAYEEGSIIELSIVANSELASARQNCYIQKDCLIRNAQPVISYSLKGKSDTYIEFGRKEGNFTPACSLRFLPADYAGHVKIEVDIEIEDNEIRAHRSCFYIKSELGAVERFGEAMKKLVDAEIGREFALNN